MTSGQIAPVTAADGPGLVADETASRTAKDVRLVQVSTDEDWLAFHAIRKAELFDPRGRVYDSEHPDDRHGGNAPMVLKRGAECLGVMRIDNLGGKQVAFRLVAIQRDLQRQGYGRAMMDLAAEQARAAGASEIVLNSSLDAAAFYRRTGFNEFSWPDPWFAPADNVQMRRLLA